MSSNNQSKIQLTSWKQYKHNYRHYWVLMDKGIRIMMGNNLEELALLDQFLIPFQIYKIKEVHSQDLMTLQIRRPTWVNLEIHVVDKEAEGSGNQTTKETMNTNYR